MIKKFLKKLFIPILCSCLVVPSVAVNATGTINSLQNQSDSLQKQLNDQQNQFVSILTQITGIEEDIAENTAEIAETEQNLYDAQLAEQTQYLQMCKRIQYNYENKEENIFTYFLTATSFSDFLNQIEYANSIYKYDSELLDSYEATRIEIEEIKADLETQKAALALKQESLNQKKQELETLIARTKAQKQDVDKQLEAAKAEAARRAAEEAARRRAEREAARAAAARAAANAAAARARQNSSGSGGGNGNNSSSYKEQVVDADPAPVTGVSGGSVVGYASQFVGNPYVWGGNSLTNGCDCSGFVVQVYKNFGINLSGSRNSAALRSVGRAVSYDKMKAGDIICYPGHVGIYTGSGTIVEAQSTKAGITMGRSVNCKTIVAIRRVI